jgi:U3 small nucleolar RNA-associated protein 24
MCAAVSRVIALSHTHSGAGTPYLTDCVMGELEKLGPRFRVALKIARDPRFERLKCTHKGTYADDCLVERVKMVCFVV